MTVTELCLKTSPRADGQAATLTRYEVHLQLKSDDALDDGGAIITYLRANGYEYGSTYLQPYHTDTDAVVTEIRPSRRPQTAEPWIWDAVVIYSQPSPTQQQPGDDGLLTDDPTKWRYRIRYVTVPRTVPVWTAVNIDAYPRPTAQSWMYNRPADTLGPVVNSAGVTLDPPLTRQLYDLEMRVTGNALQYQDVWGQDLVGLINQNSMNYSDKLVNNYNVIQYEHFPFTALCTQANATYQFVNNLSYWQYEIAFRFRDQDSSHVPYGPTQVGDAWLETVLDSGIDVRKTPGAPDGEGGTIPPSQETDPNDVTAGTSPVGKSASMDGKTTRERVLFNGRGYPLADSDPNAASGVWFRYRIHDFYDFETPGALPLDIFKAVP